MTILHIIESPSWTGAMAQTLELLLGLKERGHRVALATSRGSILWERAEAAGVETLEVETRSELNPVAIAKLVSFILRNRVDIVHAHRAHAHSLGLIAAAMAGRPFLVSRRVSFPPKDNVGSRIKYGSRFVTGIIAVSQAVKDVLVDYGVAPEKVVVIYSGSDPCVYRGDIDGAVTRAEFGIPETAPLVGKIANYYHGWKGHDTFLAAAVEVRKTLPDARFILAGHRTDGDKMKAMVDGFGLTSQVALAGYRTDVPQILAALDVSVNCPRAGEGLSGAVRESLAAGKPVVATDVGGNRELVVDGRTGLLVPPDDPAALAAAILKLVMEPGFANQMAERGAAFVRENLTVRRMVDETEMLYLGIAEGRPVGRHH